MTPQGENPPLFVLQININSISNKINEIKQLVNIYNNPIILINNSRLAPEDPLFLENYYALRRDHKSHSRRPGGVVALIPAHINSNHLTDFNDLESECICFEICLNNHTIHIATAYVHPRQELPARFYDLLNRNLNNSFSVFLGDTNAHLGLLDQAGQNRLTATIRPRSPAGERLMENFHRIGFTLTNDLVPTFRSASSTYTEMLDTCFVRPGHGLHWSWSSADLTTSDHDVTCLNIYERSPRVQQKKVKVLDYKLLQDKMTNASWPKIRSFTINGVNQNIMDITNKYQELIEKSSKAVRKKPNGQFKMSSDLKELNDLRRKLNHLRSQDTGDEALNAHI